MKSTRSWSVRRSPFATTRTCLPLVRCRSVTTAPTPALPPSWTPTPTPPSSAPGLLADRIRLSRSPAAPVTAGAAQTRPQQGIRLMYLRHFTFTRFPFAANLEADELFASVACREAEARLKHLLPVRRQPRSRRTVRLGRLPRSRGAPEAPARTTRHRPAHRRGRLRQDHRLPPRHRQPPSRPAPRVLRLPLHRQRSRHVQVDRLGTRPARRTLPRHRLPRHQRRDLSPRRNYSGASHRPCGPA